MTESRTRLSLSEHGPLCLRYDVTLDGVKQTRCIIADSEESYVVRYRNNAFGVPALDRNGRRTTELVRGVVTITKKTS